MKYLPRRLSVPALLAVGISILCGSSAYADIRVQRTDAAAPIAVAEVKSTVSTPSRGAGKESTLRAGSVNAANASAVAPFVWEASSSANETAAAKGELTGSTPSAVVPSVDTSFEIKKGVRIDTQLAEYARRHGWELIWQAPEFVFEQNKVLPGDFEAALTFFLNGVNETGEHLRATFYRGNKTVRVTEF